MAEANPLSGYRTAEGEFTLPIPGSTLEVMPAGAEPVQFSGAGTIVTFTIVGVAASRFKEKTPYALAVIELREGARLMGLVDGGTAQNLTVGAALIFDRKDEFGYHFRLA